MNNKNDTTFYFANNEQPGMIENIKYLRVALYHLYRDTTSIFELEKYITSYIDCNSIDYNPDAFEIGLRIKKTSMKKIKEFAHKPEFYYNILINAFYDFIQANIRPLSYWVEYEGGTTDMIDDILCNKNYLSMIFNIVCINDNMIYIKL